MFFNNDRVVVKIVLITFFLSFLYIYFVIRSFVVPNQIVKPLISPQPVSPDYLSVEPVDANTFLANFSQEQNLPESQAIIRKTQVFRGTDFSEDVFYRGKTEIARQTTAPDGSIALKGVIPDGEVKFEDSYNNTYGEETYIDGLKDGVSLTYCDGHLRSKAEYRRGKLLWVKEYFHSGVLRSEINYQLARDLGQEKEVGVGKLYYPDGILKYEWDIRKNREGFKKSYNNNGELRAATYYDETGRIKQP